MRTLAKVGLLLCSLAYVGLAAAPANAAAVSFKLVDQGQVLGNVQVVLYLSYDKQTGATNDAGLASFDVARGCGFWIEVNGARLRQFYREGNVPTTIDIAQVGTRPWNGGR